MAVEEHTLNLRTIVLFIILVYEYLTCGVLVQCSRASNTALRKIIGLFFIVVTDHCLDIAYTGMVPSWSCVSRIKVGWVAERQRQDD